MMWKEVQEIILKLYDPETEDTVRYKCNSSMPGYQTGHFNILVKVAKISWILGHLLKNILKIIA